MATGIETILQPVQLWMIVVYVIAIIWSIIWKGIALWKSGRLNHKVWFIVLLIVNTLGILEILYIFVFSKYRNKPLPPKKKQLKKKKNKGL